MGNAYKQDLFETRVTKLVVGLELPGTYLGYLWLYDKPYTKVA